jgi:hypothetical protein
LNGWLWGLSPLTKYYLFTPKIMVKNSWSDGSYFGRVWYTLINKWNTPGLIWTLQGLVGESPRDVQGLSKDSPNLNWVLSMGWLESLQEWFGESPWDELESVQKWFGESPWDGWRVSRSDLESLHDIVGESPWNGQELSRW